MFAFYINVLIGLGSKWVDLFSGIDWDGKDDYGDTIGRGVYVYKVEVKSEDGSKGEEYQKLVILK